MNLHTARKWFEPSILAKAVRGTGGRRRNPIALEPMEPRLLLSDTPFSAAQAAALTSGAQGLAAWADALDASGALAQSLPVYTLADASNPDSLRSYTTLGSKVDLGGKLGALLATPLKNYFAGDATPTLNELVTVLDAVAGVNVTGSADNGQAALQISIDSAVTASSGTIDIVSAADGITSKNTLAVSGQLKFDFVLGLDLTPGLVAEEAFFIRVPNDGLALSVQAQRSGNAAFAGRVGFLDVSLAGASTIDLAAAIKVNVTHAAVNADGKVTLAELNGTELSSLVTQNASGTLAMKLPTSATLGSFTPSGVMTLADANLFDAAAPVVALSGFEQMLKFNHVDSADVQSLFNGLGNFLNSLQARNVLSFDVPFVTGEHLAALDDFGSAYAAKVLPVVAGFTSAQQVGTLLSTALGLPANASVAFDPLTNELTWKLKLTTAGSQSSDVTLDIPDVGALHDVTTTRQATLTTNSSLEFTFGVQLTPVAPSPGDSIVRHAFVKGANLEGNVAMTSQDLFGAFGSYGLVDFSVGPTASGTSKLTRSLQDPVTSASQITLESLLSGIVSTPGAVTTASVLSGASQLVLPGIALSAAEQAIVGSLGPSPSITLAKTAPGAATTLTLNAGAAPLAKIASLDGADIVAALQAADAYLAKIATLGRLGEPIPGLGVSAAELLHIADALDATIASLSANPPTTFEQVASKISSALTAAGKTGVSVTFVADAADSNALKLSLQFGSATSAKMPLQLDLAALAALAAGGTHAADDQLALVDATATANRIDVDASASFKLDLGIDLTNPAQPAPFIYDSSSVTLTARIAETGLALALVAGPVQVAVAGGSVLLDKDGPGGTNNGAEFAVDVKDPGATSNGRITADELALIDAASDVGIAVTGQLQVSLPSTFGNPSQNGTLALSIANLGNVLDSSANSVATLTIPDFSSAVGATPIADNRGVVADGFNQLLDTLQDAVDSEIFGKNLPFVGDQISDLANGVLDDFRSKLIDPLRTQLGSQTVQQALFNVLNPLGVLGETDGVGGITVADVMQTATGYKLLLDYDIFSISEDLAFDIGLPGLNLSSDADLKVDLGFKWMLEFGVDATSGFFIDTSAAEDLELALIASLVSPEDANGNGRFDEGEDTGNKNNALDLGTGELGFLKLLVTDGLTDDNIGSHFGGSIGVDLKGLGDNRLTLGELASAPLFGNLIAPTLDLEADIKLGLNVTFGGSIEFPNFSTTLRVQWALDGADPNAGAGPSVLAFENVALELGSFVTDLLGPVVHGIKDVLDPVKPVFDFLTTRIPVLSDVPGLKQLLGEGSVTPNPAGDGLTLLEIANRVGSVFGVPPQIADAIAVIDKVNDIANLLTGDSLNKQLNLQLGTFNLLESLNGQSRDIRQDGALDNLVLPAFGDSKIAELQAAARGLVAGTPIEGVVNKTLDKVNKGLSQAGLVPSQYDLQFPVLDNPTTLFGLLVGQDVPLFQWDVPAFELDTGFLEQTVPLLGPLSLGIYGNLKIAGDFAFGYDTYGLSQFAKPGGTAADFADGFWVSDTGAIDPKLADISELTVSGAITARAQFTVPLAAFGVEGGVFANLVVDLEDANKDGRIRASEIADEVAQGPLCLFQTSGDVHAGLHAYVKVGFDTPLGFVSVYEDNYDIASKVLLNLDHDCEGTIDLATQSGGTLTLNMGSQALRDVRGGGTEGEINERYEIRHYNDEDRNGNGVLDGFEDINRNGVLDRGSEDLNGNGKLDEGEDVLQNGVLDTGVIEVLAFGQREYFKGVTLIVGNAADGNDTILVAPNLNVRAELKGGTGDDLLQGGAAGDLLEGEANNDTLIGGGGNDTLRGGADHDVIFGNAGDDRIDGDGGNDRLYGGNGTDDLDQTGDGADTIFGHEGNDVLLGNLGNDQLSGGAGNDQLSGGDGDDLMAGGDHNDLLEGNLGADRLYSDTDLDAVIAGQDDDRYDGADELFGDARNPNHPGRSDGRDLLFAGRGNDRLVGGLGNDDLFGGAGDDRMFGDARIEVGPETVLASGETDDDYFEGGKGSDAMFGGAGTDRMIGGSASTDTAKHEDQTGADTMFGDSGNDTLLGDNARFGSVILIGGSGSDSLLGGDGDDLIYGQGGNDNAEGGNGNDTIYGNAGDDTLRGNDGNDHVEGHSGGDAIHGGSGDDDLVGGAMLLADLEGLLDVADLIVGDGGNDVILGDNGTIAATTRAVQTDSSGGAGDDALYGGADDDVVFGEGGADRMFGDVAGGTGRDILVGDQGSRSATAIQATHSSIAGSAGADVMRGGGGADILLGGDAADDMTGDDGNDVLVGDNGQVTLAGGIVVRIETTEPAFGAGDTITGGKDDDVALGGAGGDAIDGGDNTDVLLGDNGLVDFLFGSDTDAGTLDLIRSYSDGSGGSDTIGGGAGGDVAIGGTAGDTIHGDNTAASSAAGDGADILIGDNADIVLKGSAGRLLVQVAGRAQGTAVASIQTTDTSASTGGVDTVSGNAGGDVILGGVAADKLYGDAATPVNAQDGADILLGDNGRLDFAFNGDANLGTLDLIRSSLDGLGGSDEISGNAGGDVAIGGTAGDTMYGDNATASAGGQDGSDILLGDNADIFLADPASGAAIIVLGGGVATLRTTDSTTATGGSDTIVGNAGGDIIAGGVLAETIYGDAPTKGAFDGNDVILGDNGRLEWLYRGDTAHAAIEATLPGAFDTSLTTLDLITTEVPAAHPGGQDTIFGDAGNDVAFGGEYADDLYGDTGTQAATGGGSDILFGDHGRLYPNRSALTNFPSRNFFAIDTGNGTAAEGDRLWGESGDDVMLGEQGDDRLWGGSGNDDIVGGSNVAGAVDELAATDIAATLGGAAVNDLIDGGGGDDAIAGDNAIIWRRASIDSARFQTLTGTAIYSSTDSTESVNVSGTPRNDPNGVVGRDIVLLDHTDATPAGLYGDDVIAGGAGNDLAFGQLGNDLIQGDGALDAAAAAAPVVSRTIVVTDSGTTPPDTDQTLYFNVPEATTDGDDYLEGNGGSDLIYGGLGQDDIIGGSSGLFGLTTRDQRPDAGDTLYGGAATPAQLARNSSGSAGVDGHARDADVIVGDNGNIYRLVSAAGQYLRFNYDTSVASDPRGSQRIVPRAISLLDYTLGGPDTNAASAALDRGGADLIHGEGGDDIAYGQKGDDVLYGEGQSDDLIGGYGNDWISGGTGEDGVIGDDGRIRTSRNGSAEPLYGVNTASVQQTIATPGNIQQATINVTGTLTKAVDLTPLSNDPAWNAATDEFGGITRRNADDIIFGGLGSDFLHGGSGDDAISGAEALVTSWVALYDPLTHLPSGFVQSDYTHPVNPGYALAFNPIDVDARHTNPTRAGEFALYDEYDPLRRIVLGNGGAFFLDFNPADAASDGDDRIFGDLGNDWMVGGTGRDDLFGGFGNDLLNADDDPTTHGGANDQPDTNATYEDRAFGGAGRDVLIANTGGDRLIDWTGEFNTYLVPFSPFGMATVSRTLQPHLADFLYALSAADGADPTRAADKAAAGADPARNGEPWGELGLVLQKDAAWGDQHGGPSDPQAGNLPGTPRDVLRSANFDTGSPQGFVPASGNWSVVNKRYQVTPPAGGGDAISLFNQAETVIPSYFEMQATINAVKPVAGTKANAFLIFDYQGPTDFKYAGIDISLNKLVIGHRTASGWVVDATANAQLKSGIDYVVLLKVNGSAVSVTIANVNLAHTFAPRIDARGVAHAINDGIVGIGGNNAAAQIDNVVVQAPPAAITLDRKVDFSAANPASGLFGTPTAGSWQVTGDGRFVGTSAAANAPAVNLIGIAASPGSLLEITTTLKTGAQGGVVFDYHGPTVYKFATLSADSKQVLIGHSTAAGLVIDASFAINVNANADYQLKVSLRGSLVNVSLNGAVVASKLYNETVTVGGYGLIACKGATSGQTSFDSVQVKTDDAAYAASLLAAAVPTTLTASTAADAGTPSDAALTLLVDEARRRWAAAGVDALTLQQLDTIQVQVVDLPGFVLGQQSGDTILIDRDAAGHGWFIDTTPGTDTEFTDGSAAGRIDLLTVLQHELGHALGFEHGDGTMAEALAAGARETPMAAATTTVPAAIDWHVPATRPAAPEPAAAGWEWQQRFVNHLGAPAHRLNPNAGLRVHLPVASALAAR
jgi:Ca2+-binding RTX toxin-like protein